MLIALDVDVKLIIVRIGMTKEKELKKGLEIYSDWLDKVKDLYETSMKEMHRQLEEKLEQMEDRMQRIENLLNLE